MQDKDIGAAEKDSATDRQMIAAFEWLSATEVGERLNIGATRVGKLASRGFLSQRKADKKYPWPKVEQEYKTLMLERQNNYVNCRMPGMPAPAGFTGHKDEMPPEKPAPAPEAQEGTPPATQPEQQPESPAAQREFDIHNLKIGERIIAELKRGMKGSEGLAYQFGKALNEVAKARKQMLELLQMEGQTFRREEVEAWVQQTSRQNRGMWLNWPQITSQEMAEELGIDSKHLHDVLLKAVRKNLERIATLPENYQPDTDGSLPARTDATS